VKTVDLIGAEAVRNLARSLTDPSLRAFGLVGLPRKRIQHLVFVDSAIPEEHLGAIWDREEGQQLVRGRQLLVHAARDVLGLSEDLDQFDGFDDVRHARRPCDIVAKGSIF
jgi:hypothetical protein